MRLYLWIFLLLRSDAVMAAEVDRSRALSPVTCLIIIIDVPGDISILNIRA
jgi:hypothetical protein